MLAENSGDLGLVLVVLLGIAVAAVNHQAGHHALSLELGLGLLDAGSIVVGALLTAAQDNEAVRVADSAHDGDNTGLGHRQEVVGRLDGTNGIHSDVKGAVGAVLETNGEGQTGGQLTVNLGLGGASANGADGKTISQELRGDSVKHLASDRHALVGQIHEELAGGTQTLVDLEAVVDIGVVDQALPANSSTRLLQVGAHDNQQFVRVFLLQLEQTIAVLQGHIGIVDRAGSDDHHETLLLLIGTMNDCHSLIAALQNRLPRFIGQCDLMLKEVRWGERVVADDCMDWLGRANW